MGNKPSGIRDGAFVVFKNWDMPLHDIAYYPKLAGQLDDLKNVALSSPGALITAFNTKGWMKSCSFHDPSKWVASPGCDLYLRVEYPGWYFIQGMDSIGNDIGTSPLGTNVAALMVNTIVNFPEDETTHVAGFNTDGWVKAKISKLTRSSDFPLDGLYVRTEFQGYEFYQGVDSPGGDITRRSDLVDDIPSLISASNSYANSLGFNTDGWIKSTMKVPPIDRPPSFDMATKGDYVRVDWPGFAYLPMLDSPGNDAWQLPDKRVWELVDTARAYSEIIAFNTSGWMKTSLNDVPIEVLDQSYPLYGLYVKEPNLANTKTVVGLEDVKLYLFILKATAFIWGKWLLADAAVRAEYNAAVYYGSQRILDDVNLGKLTPLQAAEQAVNMRNTYLTEMRQKSSSIGRVVAQAIKPSGLPYQVLLDKYAQRRYGKNFAQLVADEAAQVAGDTIDSAGRANKGITTIMKKVGYVSKGLIVIGAAVSVYQVVTADDWKFEIGRQVATWSGAITGGQLGAGVGVIVGPIGAILGGLIGGIIGGIAGEGMAQLAHWFFGGSSSRSAEEILGPALLSAASVALQKQLSVSDQNYHVHQLLSTHVSEHNAHVASVVADIVEDMIATKSMMRVGVEVIATIVWVVTPQGILPANGANPADLIALMNWASQNLPK